MTEYCANCEREATHVAIHEENNPPTRTPLCSACADAYEWGQANPDALVMPIDAEEDEQDN